MALTRLLVNQLTLLESKQVFDMVPNKKGLQVVMKGGLSSDWENKIFTLTGGTQVKQQGEIFYPVLEHRYPINTYFMVPLNSLKLLILNKQEKEN